MAAPCAPWNCVRGPVRKYGRGRPFNGIVSPHRIGVSAISLFVPCGAVAVASVPLMLKLVPPNRIYGFRTRQTLASPDVWFRANRFAGCALFIASGITAAIFAIRPELASGYEVAGVAVLLASLIVALGASFAYVRAIGVKEMR